MWKCTKIAYLNSAWNGCSITADRIKSLVVQVDEYLEPVFFITRHLTYVMPNVQEMVRLHLQCKPIYSPKATPMVNKWTSISRASRFLYTSAMEQHQGKAFVSVPCLFGPPGKQIVCCVKWWLSSALIKQALLNVLMSYYSILDPFKAVSLCSLALAMQYIAFDI